MFAHLILLLQEIGLASLGVSDEWITKLASVSFSVCVPVSFVSGTFPNLWDFSQSLKLSLVVVVGVGPMGCVWVYTITEDECVKQQFQVSIFFFSIYADSSTGIQWNLVCVRRRMVS